MMNLFGTSLFELIYSWKHYNISEAKAEIEKVRSLSNSEFITWQKKQKWDAALFLYTNNMFYRDFVGKYFPKEWEDLPIITKADFQSNLEGLLSNGFKAKDIYVNNTSGSSGHPLTFAKDYYTQTRVWAYKQIFSNMHNIDYFTSKEAKFYGMPKGLKASLVQKLKDKILKRERFVVFDLSNQVFESWIKRFRTESYDYIYGYTSSIVLFCRYLIKQNIVLKDICPTIKTVIVTSEACSLEDKLIIKKACGVEARNEYGTADAGLIGYECPSGNIHIAEENVFVETNGKNEILVTDLFNQAFPLIRYKIGDIAIISESPCPCGDKNRIITKLQGRTNDVALLHNGKTVPGLTFYYISRALLESSGILKEFIIRQTSMDTFEFDVVSDTPLKPNDVEELKKTAEDYLEPNLNIIVNQVDKIERPASGKIKHFYSEL